MLCKHVPKNARATGLMYTITNIYCKKYTHIYIPLHQLLFPFERIITLKSMCI